MPTLDPTLVGDTISLSVIDQLFSGLVELSPHGPFRLKAWQQGESVVLVRNPEYHGHFGGNVQQVELSLHKDPTHQNILLEERTVTCPDPDVFLNANIVRSITGWKPPNAYDTLMEKARPIADPEERMRLYGQADRVLVEEAVILPLTYDRLHLLVKPWVTKFPIAPHWLWFLKDVIIEPH